MSLEPSTWLSCSYSCYSFLFSECMQTSIHLKFLEISKLPTGSLFKSLEVMSSGQLSMLESSQVLVSLRVWEGCFELIRSDRKLLRFQFLSLQKIGLSSVSQGLPVPTPYKAQSFSHLLCFSFSHPFPQIIGVDGYAKVSKSSNSKPNYESWTPLPTHFCSSSQPAQS